MSQFTEISENSRQKNLKPMEYPRSILSVEDFPAKTLAQQVKELVSLIVKGTLPAPVFGESMPGLFASLNQDGLWLKTWQGYCQSLLPGFVEEDSELYSETWTKWGIVLDGHAMELPMLERHINESECLLWHTSDCSDRRSPKSKQQGVNNQVKAYWRTPQSHNGAQGPKSKMFYEKCLKTGQSAITLVDQVKNWPTPAARDSKGSNSAKHLSTGHHINQLANKVKLNKTERLNISIEIAELVSLFKLSPVNFGAEVKKGNEEKFIEYVIKRLVDDSMEESDEIVISEPFQRIFDELLSSDEDFIDYKGR